MLASSRAPYSRGEAPPAPSLHLDLRGSGGGTAGGHRGHSLEPTRHLVARVLQELDELLETLLRVQQRTRAARERESEREGERERKSHTE